VEIECNIPILPNIYWAMFLLQKMMKPYATACAVVLEKQVICKRQILLTAQRRLFEGKKLGVQKIRKTG